MRTLRFILIALVILGSAWTVFPTSAQTPPTLSTGCQAVNGQSGNAAPTFLLPAGDFLAGEVVTLTVVGAGNSFEMQVGGVPTGAAVALGTTVTYTVPADGNLTFSANVNGPADATTIATFACSAAGSGTGGEIPEGNVTVCHRPPGNPGNAHTITVGSKSAAEAHLAHGDSLGNCNPEEQARSDDADNGDAFFVNRIELTLEIYGNCVAENCQLLIKIDLKILINSTDEELVFDDDDDASAGDGASSDDGEVDDQDSDNDGDVDGDGVYVIIFFLGKSHKDPTVKVFQVNVYNSTDDTLVSDNLLIFVTLDGKISWGTHEPGARP